MSTCCDKKDYRHVIRVCRHPPLTSHTVLQRKSFQSYLNKCTPNWQRAYSVSFSVLARNSPTHVTAKLGSV